MTEHITSEVLWRELLILGPLVDDPPYEYCVYCNVYVDKHGLVEHKADCFWLRVKEKGKPC